VRIDGVSFVSTYRTEFSRVMQRSSYESLVALLRQRVSESPAADTDTSRGTSASPRAAR
jgi:hypothetical protein